MTPNAAVVWRLLFVPAVYALYRIALSASAYAATIPQMAHHEVLRKTYALLAFGLVGFVLERARIPRLGPLGAALAVGIFSAVIELGQILARHSRETLVQHAFDIASGIAGGALGVVVSRLLRRDCAVRGREIAILALLLIAIAVAYPFAY